MQTSYNLLHEGWLPCLDQDGQAAELGLRDALVRAHELRALNGDSPLVTAALHRLLLAVLHRVFGPSGYDAWAALWQAGRWNADRLDAYLDRWQSRFDLFYADRPFYQAADPRVKPKAVNSLIQDLAFGNKATLFDHHTDDDAIALRPAAAAQALVAAQAFGLAGLSGLPQKFTDGPCARGVIFFVEGDTLFETLALNLLRYPDDQVMPHSREDCPAWEQDDPFVPDRSVPRGYLDYLTWQGRRILLLPEEQNGRVVVRHMTVAPALRLDSAILDPMKHYRRDEKRGLLVLRFSEERALWRDSAALFRLGDPAYRPPLVFDWLAGLADEGHLAGWHMRRTLALGMANDQAKVEFCRSERMPLPLDYLKDKALVDLLSTAVQRAEDVGRQLWGATRNLAAFVLCPEADAQGARQPAPEDLDALMGQWGVERRYWSRLEVPFRATMESLPTGTEETLAVWSDTLRRAAREAFEAVAGNLSFDPMALKAVVRARGQLAAGLAKALPA